MLCCNTLKIGVFAGGVFEKLDPVHPIVSTHHEPPLYVKVVGATPNWAAKLICASAGCCRIPEPVRVARLIAKGLTRKPS
jgi:endonuclease V-like protein UPF0215 family